MNDDNISILPHLKVPTTKMVIFTAILTLLMLRPVASAEGWAANAYDTNQTDAGTWLLADVNGDGMADVINIAPEAPGSNLQTYLSAGDGSFKKLAVQYLSTTYGLAENWYTADLNGSGSMDVLNIGVFNGNVVFVSFFYTGGSPLWDSPTFWKTGHQTGGSWFLFDVNGDSKSDVVNLWSDSGKQTASTYLSAFTQKNVGNWQQPVSDTFAASTGGNWLPMNVTNDSLIDFVNTWSALGNESFTVYASNGKGDWNEKDNWATGHGRGGSWVPSDINGDGKGDIINYWGNGNTQIFAPYLSDGNGGWIGQTYYSTGQGTSGVWESMDVNGDGREDVVNRYTVSLNYDFRAYISTKVTGAAYNNGNQVTWNKQAVYTTGSTEAGSWLKGDINGDGKMDIVNISDVTGSTYITSYMSQYD